MSFKPINFREKAYENLLAVDRLGRGDDGLDEPLTNAIASRAYYAAYLAVAHRCQEKRVGFLPGQDYYRHDRFPEEAARHGVLDDGGHDDLIYLRDMRVKADYWEDPVESEEADAVAEVAHRLVKELIP